MLFAKHSLHCLVKDTIFFFLLVHREKANVEDQPFIPVKALMQGSQSVWSVLVQEKVASEDSRGICETGLVSLSESKSKSEYVPLPL